MFFDETKFICNLLASESGSEEGSEVSSEGAGLHWVAKLRLLPMYCGGGGQGEREGEQEERETAKELCFFDLDHILQELEVRTKNSNVLLKINLTMTSLLCLSPIPVSCRAGTTR